MREDTIIRVAKIIVRHQQGFFQYGPKALRPLGLREIAGELNIHESSVSRATSGKTMLTDRGLIPFRNFFAQKVSDQQDGQTVSAAVQEELRQILDLEASDRPESPYSDEELAALLDARGMAVARRTVAKYRGLLDIPSKGDRKRQYRLRAYVRDV